MVKDINNSWCCYTNNCHDRFLPAHGVFDMIEDKEWQEKAPKEVQELAMKQPDEGSYSFEFGVAVADGQCGMIVNIILDGGLEWTEDIPNDVKRAVARNVANTISNDYGFDVYDEHESLQEYAIFVPTDKWNDFARNRLNQLEENNDLYYRLYENGIAKYSKSGCY